MGITASEEEQQGLIDRLQFVNSLDDQHFGRIDILKFKEPPYEYIMKYTRVFRDMDEQFKRQLQFLQTLRDKQHKNLVRLYHLESREGTVFSNVEKQMCIIHVKVDLYCNYYNFTLQNAIQKKKIHGMKFPENQLWYVASTLTDLGRYLQNQQLSLGDYRSSQIFLTPEGYYIKMYMLNLFPNNKHNAFFTVMASRMQLETHLLSPEQLRAIKKGKSDIDFDVYKADVFAVGMLLLELIFMDDPKFYYNVDQIEINYDRVRYNLARLKGQLSSEMQNFLKGCLMEDPSQRYDFVQAAAYVQKLRNRVSIAGCIKLLDEQQLERKKKETKSTTGSGFKSLLTSVQGKLHVSPIVSYADRKNQSSRVSPRKQLHKQSTSSSFFTQERKRK